MILTVDFGSSATKVALWAEDGMVAVSRAEVPTTHPRPGWAEQDPASWWTSVVVGCAEVRAAAPEAFGAVAVLGCSGARQTFVPVRSSGEPLGRAIVWSDRRAGAEAAQLAEALGPPGAASALTGVGLEAGAVGAKVAWLAAHEPARLAGADWLLTPRDLVVWRLTGEVVTDASMASRSGLYGLDGRVVPVLAGAAAPLLAPVVDPGSVAGTLRGVPAAELGLRPDLPVVLGAGDRACEALGTGATAAHPMVSWGTTANVSVPLSRPPAPVPTQLVVSRGAGGGWLLEAGLSAAGSLLAWVGRLTGEDPAALAARAAGCPPGARGVVVVPWLDGARAPWWRDDARAAVVGLSSAHDATDLARAVLEGVAYEVCRCLDALAAETGPATGLALAGAGAGSGAWVEVLGAVTGLPVRQRRSGEAASAGTALLAAAAVGLAADLDRLDPPVAGHRPDAEAHHRYAALRARADRVAAAVLELA